MDSETLYLYFTRTGTFPPAQSALTLKDQELTQGRVGHTVTATNQNQVVIAGGGLPAGGGDLVGSWWLGEGLASLTSIEVLDETTHELRSHRYCDPTLCQQGKIPAEACDFDGCMDGMNYARMWHTATALPTGQVVLAGGYTSDVFGEPIPLADGQGGGVVEVYDPTVGEKGDILQYSLSKARAGHTATLIDPVDFQILFLGGDLDGSATYEIWSPYSGSSGAQPLPDGVPRRHHTATLFEVPWTGTSAVLVAGGQSSTSALGSILVYDVGSGLMVPKPYGLPRGPRTHLSAGLDAESGYIHLVGGFTDAHHTAPSDAIDVYDIHQDECLEGVGQLSLTTARGAHATAVTSSGEVIITGGVAVNGAGLQTAESITRQYVQLGDGESVLKIEHSALPSMMPTGRLGHRSVTTNTGLVLLVGGMQGGGGGNSVSPVLGLDVYNPY